MFERIVNFSDWASLVAIVIFFSLTGTTAVYAFSHNRWRHSLMRFDGISPTFLALPVTIFSFTAALMGTSLWDNFTGASNAINKEVRALESFMAISSVVPRLNSFNLQSYAIDYADAVVHKEWQTMEDGQVDGETEEKFLRLQLKTFDAINSLGNSAETKVLTSVFKDLSDARYQRLNFASVEVFAVRWVAVILLGVMVQVGIASVHISRPGAMKMAMWITTASILIAVCTIALTLNTPYSGILRISNTPFLNILHSKNGI